MSLTHVPVVGAFKYRDADATPAAFEDIHFIAVTRAKVDGETVTLPKKLICTLDVNGQVPDDFTLPTVGDGVYYTVKEKFSGGRADYIIQVLPTDTEIDLATVAPVVPEIPGVAYLRTQDIGVSVASQDEVDDHETRIVALEESPGGGASLSDANPEALGAVGPGTGVKASREDHVHPMPSAADVGAATPGSVTAAIATAAADATAKADAAQAAAIAASDSDGLAEIAYTEAVAAASTDASAKASAAVDIAIQRANHTGTQEISTVSGLQSALDGKIDANTPITGATKTKITYDADGLVTAGADATTADIADSSNKRYVTDAQLVVVGNTSGTNTGDLAAIDQATAEAGSSTTLLAWTSLRVRQAINAALALGTWISGATAKTTPVDADTFAMSDSAASNALKKVTWANLKAAILAYVRTPNIQTITSASTITPTFSNDMVKATGQAVAFQFLNPTGTAIPAVGMVLRVKATGAYAITYDTQYRQTGTTTLPTTTVSGKWMLWSMLYSSDDTKWDIVYIGATA